MPTEIEEGHGRVAERSARCHIGQGALRGVHESSQEKLMRLVAAAAFLLGFGGPLPLAAQDSVACKNPGGPMHFLASGVSPWRRGPSGVERMNLVGHPNPSATEIVVYRERYPATFMSDSARAMVQRNVGTVYIIVLKGTLVVGRGANADFSNVAAYGPWSFVVIAAAEPFYVWSRGAVEIQVEAIGPPHPGPIIGGTDLGMMPTFPAASSQKAPPESPPAPANGLGEWKMDPRGVGTMRLAGSTPPSATELSAGRLLIVPPALQDSVKLTYHFHYGTELVTIICGTIAYGQGTAVDYSKVVNYGPGSFIENPAGNPHFEWARGALEAEVEFIGGPGAVPLDPLTGKPLP
jgi:hypothetical protein